MAISGSVTLLLIHRTKSSIDTDSKLNLDARRAVYSSYTFTAAVHMTFSLLYLEAGIGTRSNENISGSS